MRVKVGFRSVSRDQYNDFCKKYPDIHLEYEQWKEIIYSFNYDFRDYILTYGDKAKMPFGFGDLSINKRKVRRTKLVDGVEKIALPIDWKKTKEKGKYIYNFNYHTEGYRFKWLWFPRTARFKHAELWIFKPFRTASRKITEFLSRTDVSYIDVYKEWR
jgi:hypothetical protein